MPTSTELACPVAESMTCSRPASLATKYVTYSRSPRGVTVTSNGVDGTCHFVIAAGKTVGSMTEINEWSGCVTYTRDPSADTARCRCGCPNSICSTTWLVCASSTCSRVQLVEQVDASAAVGGSHLAAGDRHTTHRVGVDMRRRHIQQRQVQHRDAEVVAIAHKEFRVGGGGGADVDERHPPRRAAYVDGTAGGVAVGVDDHHLWRALDGYEQPVRKGHQTLGIGTDGDLNSVVLGHWTNRSGAMLTRLCIRYRNGRRTCW